MALMFGTAGLPHILMRFFTVPNAKEARKSVLYATGFIGYFYILTFIIGFGAIVFVSTNPDFIRPRHRGRRDRAAATWRRHLAKALGGDLMLGFISAVAFATILAVVSGLTLAGASAISHDLYASVFRHGNVDEATEVRVSRITTIVLGIVAIILGVLFEKINVAFMVGLAFAVAASANFPVLLLSMLWKGLTTRGAFIGGFVGLISAVVLTFSVPASGWPCLGSRQGRRVVPLRLAGPVHHAAVVPSAAGSSRSPTSRRRRRRSRLRSKLNMFARRRASARKAPPSIRRAARAAQALRNGRWDFFPTPRAASGFLIGGPRALKSSTTKVVMAGIRPSRKP